MKKVIGIYCGNLSYKKDDFWDSDTIKSKGCGGSELWAIKLASSFNAFGFHVIVFGHPQYWHFDGEGVEYVPYSLFESRIQYQHFDYFISSRRIDELSSNISCDNIYLMSHEIGIFDSYWGNFAKFDQLQMNRVKKIAVLSEWHKKATMELYPQLREDQLFITHNAIDQDLYQNVDMTKKRDMIVWSSCLNRGLTFFGQRVLPKIWQELPHLEVNICSYDTNIHGIIPEAKNVHFLGTLNKNELSQLQKEAKIWALPNYGLNDFGQPLHESFCITAVENALAKNGIVCFNKDGLTTTLGGYSNIMNIDWFDEYKKDIFEEEFEKLSSIMANNIIEMIKNDDLRNKLAEEAYNICSKYTWKNSALTWLKEWGMLYE